jgi:hypothetical protein
MTTLCPRFLTAALAGLLAGTMIGSHSAAKAGTDIFRSAAVLAGGMGLFSAGLSLTQSTELKSDFGPKADINNTAAGLAVLEFCGGVIGYAAFVMLVEQATTKLPFADLAMAMAKDYPFAVAFSYAAQVLEEYFTARAMVAQNLAESHRLMG